MQFTSYLAVFSIGLLAPFVAAAPADIAPRLCTCTHNSDAGRWIDNKYDPFGAVKKLQLNDNGDRKCLSATTQGIMCLKGDYNEESCLKNSIKDWQSYHGDWFIWTRIDCGNLRFTLQAN